MEMLYRKVGRKYVPFKPFEGFPANGIWLVKKDGNSQTLTVYLDDLHMKDLRIVTELSKKYDKLLDAIINNGWFRQMPARDITSFIIKTLSKYDENKGECNEKDICLYRR